MRCVNIYAALVVGVLLVLQLTEAASPHNQPRFLGRRHRKLHGGSATCAKLGGRCAEWSACDPKQGKKMPIQSTDLCPAPSGKDQSVWVCCFDHDLAKKGPLECTKAGGDCMYSKGKQPACDKVTQRSEWRLVDKLNGTSKQRLCPMHKDIQCCMPHDRQEDADWSFEVKPEALPSGVKTPTDNAGVENLGMNDVVTIGGMTKGQLMTFFNEITNAKASEDPEKAPDRQRLVLDRMLKKFRSTKADNPSLPEPAVTKIERGHNMLYSFYWNWRRQKAISWINRHTDDLSIIRALLKRTAEADTKGGWTQDIADWSLIADVESIPEYLRDAHSKAEPKMYAAMRRLVGIYEKTIGSPTYKMKDGWRLVNLQDMYGRFRDCITKAWESGREPGLVGDCKLPAEAQFGAMRLKVFTFVCSVDRVPYTVKTFGQTFFQGVKIVTPNAYQAIQMFKHKPIMTLHQMLFFQGLLGKTRGFDYPIQNAFFQVLYDATDHKRGNYNESVDGVSSAVAGLLIDLSVRASAVSAGALRNDGGKVDSFKPVADSAFRLGYFLSAIDYAGKLVLDRQKQMTNWGGAIVSWAVKKTIGLAIGMGGKNGAKTEIGNDINDASKTMTVDFNTFSEAETKKMNEGLDKVNQAVGMLADYENGKHTEKMTSLMDVFKKPVAELIKALSCNECEKHFQEGVRMHKDFEPQMTKHETPAWWEKIGEKIFG